MTSAATQFGGLPLPVPGPASGTTVADPGLDALLSFARAVINRELSTSYNIVAPGLGKPVKTARAHNPGLVVFSESDLAALFAWRTSGEIETEADDYELETSKLSLLWVLPPSQQEHLALRGPIVNGVAKALLAALKRGRHPSWVVDADSDPLASTEGSFLYEWAGWFHVERRIPWKLQELVASKMGAEATYPALQVDLTVRERVVLGQSKQPLKLVASVHLPDQEDEPLVSMEFPKP